MILVDTSAWAEFDRTTGSSVDQRMAALISTDGPLAVTQPIALEAVAWRHADSIRSCDVDLDQVCGVVGVPLDPASLRAP